MNNVPLLLNTCTYIIVAFILSNFNHSISATCHVISVKQHDRICIHAVWVCTMYIIYKDCNMC